MNPAIKKGFTLIELLIVIALVAILAVTVLLYINPVEFLRQARDSNRLSDLSTLQKAIALYQSDVAGAPMGTAGVCYMQSAVGTSTANCKLYFQTASTTATSTSDHLDGTGWVPINFMQISSGNPISQLPTDPLRDPQNANFFYSYITSSKSTFKLAAKLESKVYGFGGDRDAVSTDNGVSTTTLEIGSDVTL